jgi:hypothetical protein
MLTHKTALRAAKQMSSYGELQSGALDQLQSNVIGHKAVRRQSPMPLPVMTPTPKTIRRWNEDLGDYEYVDLPQDLTSKQP